MSKKTVAGVLSVFVVAGVPVGVADASASPGHPSTPPLRSQKCAPHAVAYRVSGKLVSSSLTLSGSGGHQTASGMVTIAVTSANEAAKDAGVTKGSTQPYTLTGARVTYAHRVVKPNPAAGTHTVVKGTITVVAKHGQERCRRGDDQPRGLHAVAQAQAVGKLDPSVVASGGRGPR
jgi:hypothetical protein